MLFNFDSRIRARCLVLEIASAFLASCAAAPSDCGSELSRLHLFAESNSPRFSFYYSCVGDISAEMEMCWVPSKYFALWAEERHVTIKQLPGSIAFDAGQGVPVDQLARTDAGLDYRIVVRFKPIAVDSDFHYSDNRVDYSAPKAGYQADLYIYAIVGGKLVMQTDYHKKSDAASRGDAVPYVKDGVQTVLAALDPAYAQANPIPR